ncbi:MAG TPA: tetratricopeptide repeat protein, partial [Ktedonobacteraceae bacterium]|nr:tetratricopeptide repeat protein [Ktedonobacteraceae bacterium]
AAREHLLLAVTIYRSQHNIRGEGRALTKLGEVYQRQRKFELSLSNLERALEIARMANDLRGIGWVLHNKGVTLLEARDYEQAHECLLEALQQRQHIGDQRGICWTLHNLGRLYIKQAQFEEAMAALLLAQLSFEQRQSQDGQKNQARLEELRSKVGEIEFNRLHREVSPNPSLIISAQLKRYLEQK